MSFMFATYEWAEIPRNSCLVCGYIFGGGPGSPNLKPLTCGPQMAHGAATAQHGPQNSVWPMSVIQSPIHLPTTCESAPREGGSLGIQNRGWVLFSHTRILFISITFKFRWESTFWKFKRLTSTNISSLIWQPLLRSEPHLVQIHSSPLPSPPGL